MSPPSFIDHFKNEFFCILEETFEHVHGKYLDRNTSLFETLANITAEEAMRPITARSSCIAAQVYHIRFYLDVLCDAIEGKEIGKLDWQATWRITTVSDDEWEQLRQKLRHAYERVQTVLHSVETWQGEEEIGGALAILAHTAYHLGEMRMALGVIQP